MSIQLYDNHTHPSTPDACPMCSVLLRIKDVESFSLAGVCGDCDNSHRLPNIFKWEKGWRPSEEDIERRLAARKAEPYFFSSLLDI